MISKELTNRLLTSIILFPLAIFFIIADKNIFIFFLFLITIFVLREWFSINKKKNSPIYIAGLIFIFLSTISAYFLRGDDKESIIFFVWILTICFMSDIGGYVIGKNFGKKKLTKISPKKTYEGALGSLFFSLFPIFFIYFFKLNTYTISLSLKTILLSLILSLVCQLGDIFISYVKRLNKVKNTGNLLPGHGGILDRIDGLLFVITFSAFLKAVNIF